MAPSTGIAQLSGLPLFGNLFEFRRDRLKLQRRVVDECGDVGSIRMGPVEVVVLNGPELTHHALVEHAYDFVKSAGLRKFGRPLLGDGLLTAEGDFHKRQRKLLSPAFQHKRVAAYATAMADYTERAQSRWTDGQSVDLAAEMMELTLAIVGRTLFDADVSGAANVIGQAVTDAMEYMIESVSSIAVPYSWPLPRNRKMRRAIAALDDVVGRVIAERRSEGKDRGDVLSMLLAARDDDGSGLDDRQVRDEVMTLVLAGHETTANALAWTWHLLLSAPAAYAQVHEEVDRVLAGRTPKFEDLAEMPFSLAVVKEVMRLYPPAYVIGREAIRDVMIGPHLIKIGAMLMVNIYGMHRRADLFPEPDQFRPERFVGDAEKEIPKGAYMPFGAGARVCIGNHFAMMEAHLLLVTMAQRVAFSREGSAKVDAETLVTLRPKGGVHAKVSRRGARAAAA